MGAIQEVALGSLEAAVLLGGHCHGPTRSSQSVWKLVPERAPGSPSGARLAADAEFSRSVAVVKFGLLLAALTVAGPADRDPHVNDGRKLTP